MTQLIQKAFAGEPYLPNRFGQDYDIEIDDAPRVSLAHGTLRLAITDADEDVAIAHLSPRRAKAVAAALIEVAEAIESQPLQVGDIVYTVEQLNSLPDYAVVATLNTGRPYSKLRGESEGDWLSVANNVMTPSALLYTFSPLKVVHLPEEIA